MRLASADDDSCSTLLPFIFISVAMYWYFSPMAIQFDAMLLAIVTQCNSLEGTSPEDASNVSSTNQKRMPLLPTILPRIPTPSCAVIQSGKERKSPSRNAEYWMFFHLRTIYCAPPVVTQYSIGQECCSHSFSI